MSDVEFEENNLMPARPRAYQESRESRGLTGIFIKMGIAKDKEQANKAMMVLTVIFFIITLYFITRLF